MYQSNQMNQQNIQMPNMNVEQSIVNQYEEQNMQNYKCASFGRRLGAFIIDFILIFFTAIVSFVLPTMLKLIIGLNLNNGDFSNTGLYSFISAIEMILPMLILIFGFPLYFIFSDSGKHHGTIGKRVFKTEVINEDSTYLRKGQAFLRWLLKAVLYFIYPVSIITILVTEKKQSLHDMMLKQIVIRK